MNFTLTDEQIKEFIERCVDSRSIADMEEYKYKIVAGEYPEIYVELTCEETGYSQTYCVLFVDSNMFLKKSLPYSETTGPICKDMKPIYLEYMYELFGEDFLQHAEAIKRQQISQAKKEARAKLRAELNNLDALLTLYLFQLDNVRNNTLKQ